MRLEKAIEILTRWQKGDDITSFDDVNVASKLGIEALKRLELSRKEFGYIDPSLLLGETEDYIPRNIGKLPSDEDNNKGGAK